MNTVDEAAPAALGELALQTLAMPRDTNANGDIFGGWLLAQMDIAGGVAASGRAKGRTATIGIKEMEFHKPVKVGDVVCCYADIQKVGNTSITIGLEAWALHRDDSKDRIKVTEGVFTFVALDKDGNPRTVPPE